MRLQITILNSEKSLVVVIDIQEKLLNAVYNKDNLAKKSEIITKAASILNIPILVTEQYPKGLGETCNNIKSSLPNETIIIEKTTFSALDNSDAYNFIRNSGKTQIILYGIETHICVSQTANALIDAGYDVTIVSDSCGSRSENEHNAGLDRIKSNGGKIITTEIALFEWLRSSKHPNFKEIQNLIK